MNTNSKERPRQESIDDSLFPLQFINRIISLLYLVIFIPLIVWAILTVLTYISILSPSTFSYGNQTLSAQSQQQAVEFVGKLSPLTSEFSSKLWSFLAPILTIIITIVLIRWLLFSGKSNGMSKRFSNLVKDVPSLIAVIVIITLCLLPIISSEVPAALSNIALVIVGFYFGTERRVKTQDIEPVDVEPVNDEK